VFPPCRQNWENYPAIEVNKNLNGSRKKHDDQRKYSVLELFCGCGGFSHGFFGAGAFKIVGGMDVKAEALETFRKNHQNSKGREPFVINGDVREIEIAEISRLLAAHGVAEGELDCLIGGPPCQGFSQLRRSKERKDNRIVRFRGYDRLDEDPRNDLVLRFLEIAEALRPKVIVIENVPQMMLHAHNGVDGGLATQIMNLLKEMEYSVANGVLNAAEFGVPQLRDRVFIIASRIGKPRLPEPTHADPSKDDLLHSKLCPWVTVGEAISDLPAPPFGPADEFGGGPVTRYVKTVISAFARRMQSKRHFPYNHITRQYEKSVLSLIVHMQSGETWDDASARMLRIYEMTIKSEKKPGEDAAKCRARLIESGIINPSFSKKYYWSAYTRLERERPALTITANANFLGSGRFTHPQNDRGITMREAARLQSFEDEFTFITSVGTRGLTTNIGVGLDMIGEAVPPLLSQAIAREVRTLLAAQESTEFKKTPTQQVSVGKVRNED
jgi:DNA (cytosine-5)-methyltransferase 1